MYNQYPLTLTNKILLVTLFIGSVMTMIPMPIVLELILSAKAWSFSAGIPHIWQFLTFPFVQNGLWGVLFAFIMIIAYGGEMEYVLGEKKYRKFLAVMLGVTGLSFFLLNVAGLARSLAGISIISSGLFFIANMNRLEQPVNLLIITIPLKYLMMGFALMMFLSAVNNPAHFSVIFGIVAGYIYLNGVPRQLKKIKKKVVKKNQEWY